MNTSEISFQYQSTGKDLIISVLLDQQMIYSQQADTKYTNFLCTVPDDDQRHVLEIQMSGKRPEHTVLDDHYQIVRDQVLEVNNIKFNGIDVTQLFSEKSTYSHNFNGNSNTVVDKFYGVMGCNGIVRLEFSTPIYIWFLENM